MIVSLTAQGRALRDSARAVPKQLAQATGCNARELAELTRQLQELRERMHDAHAAND